MRFQKISYNKGRVKLEYEITNKVKKDWDEFSLACLDEPKPEFRAALQALSEDVIEMCELPEEYQNRIMITGISFSYGGENEILGATIISQMALRKSNVNLNLLTPHKPSEPYSEDGDQAQCLSEDCVNRLNDLMKAAEDYINGNRAQGELFAGQTETKGLDLRLAESLRNLAPDGNGSVGSITISTGGVSATLTPETKKNLDKAIKKERRRRATV